MKIKKNQKLILVAIILVVCGGFLYTAMDLGTLYNGENESYFQELTVDGTIVGTNTIVQFNQTLETGMETDFSNVEFYDTSGTLLLQDRDFDADDTTIRVKLNTTDTSTVLYQRWGTDITSVDSDLSVASKSYWIKTSLNHAYFATDISAGETKNIKVEKTGSYTPSPNAVFPDLFDEFNSFDTNIWDVYDGSSPVISGGYATLHSRGIETDLTHSLPQIIELKGYASLVDTWGRVNVGLYGAPNLAIQTYCDKNLDFLHGTSSSACGSFSTDAEYKMIGSDGLFELYRNGALIGSSTESGFEIVPDKVQIYGRGSDGVADHDAEIKIDYIFLRQYADVTITVTNMTTYYDVEVTNNEASDLTGYQVCVDGFDFGLSSSTESLAITEGQISLFTATSGDVHYSITNNSESNVEVGTNKTIEKSFDSSMRHEWYIEDVITKNETVQNASITIEPELGMYNVTLYTYNDLDWLTYVNNWSFNCTEVAPAPVAPSSGGGGGGSTISPVVVEETTELEDDSTDEIINVEGNQYDEEEVKDLLSDNTQIGLFVLIFAILGIVVYRSFKK